MDKLSRNCFIETLKNIKSENKKCCYYPKYYEGNKYFNIDLSKLVFVSSNDADAVLQFMDYLNDNLETPIKCQQFYDNDVLFDTIFSDKDDGWVCKDVDSFLKINNSFPIDKFNSYIEEWFDNDTLWLEKRNIISKNIKKEMSSEFFGCIKKIGKEARDNDVIMTLNISKECIQQPANISCTGFFTQKKEPWYPKPTLTVTLWNRSLQTVYETLIHEYCHMLQWIDSKEGNCQAWDNYINIITPKINQDLQKHWSEEYPICEAWGVIGIWLDKKIPTNDLVKKCIRVAQDVEIDCERRTIDKIKEWNLEHINVKDYSKGANSYLYYYTYMLKHGFWYSENSKNPPYTYQKILDVMPNKIHLSNEFYYSIPKHVEIVYDSVYL